MSNLMVSPAWIPCTYPFGVTRAQTLMLSVSSWVFGALILIALGVSPRNAVAVALVVLVQAVSGAYLWTLISRGRSASALELIGMGLVLGSAISLLSGVVLSPVIDFTWNPLVPSIVLLIVFLIRMRRSRSLQRNDLSADWTFTFPAVGGFLAGLAVLVVNLQRYPLHWDGVWDLYHPDMVFFEALSNSSARYGGSDSIFMTGAEIRYHWFSYAWVGQITEIAGAEPFVVLTRVLPIVALIATVTLALAWTQKLVSIANLGSARFTRTLPWLVVALIVTGGYLGALNGTILNFDSPSQALGTAWLMGLILVFFTILQPERQKISRIQFIGQVVVLFALAGVVTGAKVSTGALAVIAIGFVALMGLLVRASWSRRAWIALFAVVVGFVVVYLTVIAGSASPGDLKFLSWFSRASTVQGLNSSPGTRGVILGTLGLTIAMAARWVGGVWLLSDRSWRTRPETFLGVGLVLGSIIPLWVFSQGLNETWFALAASAPLSVLGAFGLWLAWNSLDLRVKPAVFSLVVAAFSLLVVSYIWTDQVWESGFGRFWAPWLGYLIALLAGLFVAPFVPRKKVMTVFVVATTVLTLQASAARIVPIAGSLLGGARDGAGVTTSELADISLSESQSVTVVNEVVATEESVVVTEPVVVVESASGVAVADRGWSQDEIEAAEYLKSNADSSDVIVTNETQGFIVPALTGLRSYITGAAYQGTYGDMASVVEIPSRIELSRRFIASPNMEDLSILCDTGVRWVWINKNLDPEFEGTRIGGSVGAVSVLSNASVELVEIKSCEG